MTRIFLAIALVIGILLAGLPVAVSAAEAILEPMPDTLKEAVQGGAYQDDQFFSIAGPAIKSLSNRTIPTGSQRMSVFSAYSSMKDLSISPQRFEEAKDNLAFLYYTSKAGEAYENYHTEKNSVAALTDGSEFYDLAVIYYQVASNWWALIANTYPKVTLYSLPKQDDPFPGDDSGIGTVLEGLKFPLLMTQKEPNPAKPYQDDEMKTTVTRWIEDNIDAIPNKTDLGDESPGHYFLMGDDVAQAKSTYVDLSTKNVHPEFLDTANYIDAFLYFISQAREFYDQYLTDRTNIVSISDGQENYDMSKSYYNQAQIALNMFKDKIPDINNTTTLPNFPDIDEVARHHVLDSESEFGTKWSGKYW